jgi:hypothetical protein
MHVWIELFCTGMVDERQLQVLRFGWRAMVVLLKISEGMRPKLPRSQQAYGMCEQCALNNQLVLACDCSQSATIFHATHLHIPIITRIRLYQCTHECHGKQLKCPKVWQATALPAGSLPLVDIHGHTCKHCATACVPQVGP